MKLEDKHVQEPAGCYDAVQTGTLLYLLQKRIKSMPDFHSKNNYETIKAFLQKEYNLETIL